MKLAAHRFCEWLQILVIILVFVRATESSSTNELTECLFQRIDTNNDGKISEKELMTSIYENSTWAEWGLLKALGGPVYIMTHCDVNRDGMLTRSDLDSKDSCLQKKSLTHRLASILDCQATRTPE